jgi:tetratricopeptide (TPR) repeat protein
MKEKMTELIKQIIEISKDCTLEKLEKIEQLLEEQLQHEPENIELWLRLALLELAIPLVDTYKSIACLEKVLELNKNNSNALLLLAYINHHQLGGISEELMRRLNATCTDSAELNSMLKYAISWFYFGTNPASKDVALEEFYLKSSINLFQNHVWNHVKLAELYITQRKLIEAKELLGKALSNIKKVYPSEYESEACDITDIDEYLNERFKGIYLSFVNAESIKKLKASLH